MRKDSDPTELVSCGKCGKVNTVPFGLDKFKCYGCGSLVLVSREMSAACAAAAPTAVYYNDLEVPKPSSNNSGSNTRSTGAANLGSDSLTSEAPKKESVGFFGKLQQKMDKTMQKVDKTFQNLTTTKPMPEMPPQPSVQPLVSRGPPLAAIGSEEEQLQWALNASLSDSRASTNQASASPPVVMMGRPPNAPANTGNPNDTMSHMSSSASAGDQLQAAATNVAQKLQGTEERAAVAEKELAKALEREAQGLAQREELRRQLDDNEGIIKGLTEQIDSANLELEAKVRHCHALETALVQAQQMADQAADSLVAGEGTSELERQGTVAQLLARIAELESTLLRATHFAPEESDGRTSPPLVVSSSMLGEESSACAASVNESETQVGTGLADVATSETITAVETVPTELPVASSTQEPPILDGNSSSVPSVPIVPVIEPSVAADSVETKEDALADIVFDPVPSAPIAKAEPKEDSLKDLLFDPPPRSQENQVKPDAITTEGASETQLLEPSSQSEDKIDKESQDPNGEEAF